MDIEDDATTPPQPSRNPDLRFLGSPPETGRDAPAASDCGSPPPGVTRPASPSLAGRSGFSERLNPGTRELDMEGTKTAGVPDGDPPADKAERELSVEVDELGDTGHRPPEPPRPAPASLHVPPNMPTRLAEKPQRLLGQLVPLLPPPPRPPLPSQPTAPSPMPPPPPPTTPLPQARTFKVGFGLSLPHHPPC